MAHSITGNYPGQPLIRLPTSGIPSAISGSARYHGLLSYVMIFVFGDARRTSASYCGRMDIRQLQYLAALAREKHFTRGGAGLQHHPGH